jgi:hypothetical protein
MFRWVKMGRVFDPTKIERRFWLKEFAQAPSVIIFEDFVRVYFSCRPLPDAQRRYVSYSGYADFARSNLRQLVRVADAPILPLGGRGTFDEFGTYPVSVIRDGKIMRAYYGGWTRCESVPFNVAIGVAESHDQGQSFVRLGPGPILSYSPDEPFILSGPKVRKYGERWYLWYIAGRRWIVDGGKPEAVYKIRMAWSDDGLRWTKRNRDLVADKLGEDEAQASPDVFFHRGRYHMFFCYREASDFRTNRDRSYRIGYAWSTDLIDWTRADEDAGIDVSDEGWDSEMIAYPHVFDLDGQVYLYYLGNQVGRFGFGLARLAGTL